MALQYVTSARGKQLVAYNNFIYRKERLYREKCYWKCIQYDKVKCPGRLQSVNEVVVKEVEHSHPADPTEVPVRNVLSEIRRLASETTDNPQNIIANTCGELDAPVLGQLPEFKMLKRTIRLHRVRNGQVPGDPASLRHLIIPQQYKLVNNKNFLLHDSGPEENRILVFSTAENLEFMYRHPNWFCDGTFKASPRLFCQLYTIHAVHNELSIPVVFALLPDRTEVTYRKLFSILKELKPNLAPQTIMTDFERASINAIEHVFPETRKSGCYFHFKQCIFREIQRNPELLHGYNSDVSVSMQLKYLGALAFVPQDDVVSAYEELLETEFYRQHYEQLSEILDYMEKTWIGSLMRGNRRRRPLFSVELWNQNQNVREGLHRTNNLAESWHNSFNRLLGGHHPTIWKLIAGLQKQQVISELKVEQHLRGDITKKTFTKNEKRIMNIVNENYNSEEKMVFLRSLCHSI